MTQKNRNKLPELLAPAGSMAAGLTAFEYGADAVYAGLHKFNARERTENFTVDEMGKLITFAHSINKKVYLTFNTLIKESELTEAVETIYEAGKLSPDALIVQDIGILRILREYFPSIKIHASTQMGIHNSSGVNMLEKMGASRVILERQTTLEELELIKKNTRIELEVFIHGALCSSISGNCLLSSWNGGYSGNRGRCKQPCRKSYASDDRTGYFLSTKDLNSAEFIKNLCNIGISSLKIEGRMRKPDYIKSVVSAYRLILDSYSTGEEMQKAKSILSGIPGRKSSPGFLTLNSFKNIMEDKELGISGKLCGRVATLKNSGFKAVLSQNLHIGDRLRIQPRTGEEGPTLTLTKITVSGEYVKKAYKGTECFIETDKVIPHDGIIFKIGESGGDSPSIGANLPSPSHNIDLKITLLKNIITVRVVNLPINKEWTKSVNFQIAKTSPCCPETIQKEFQVTNSTQYKCKNVNINLEDNLFVPSVELKQLRRDFWNWLFELIEPSMFFNHLNTGLLKFQSDYATEMKNKREYKTVKSALIKANEMADKTQYDIVVHTLDNFNEKSEEIILPEFCFEADIQKIKRKIRVAVTKGHTKFRVTSLSGFDMLNSFKHISISTSFPLPAANSFAAREIFNCCAISNVKLDKIQIWLELEASEINKFIENSRYHLEIYKFGRPFLHVTRGYVNVKKEMHDYMNNRYFLKRDKSNLTYTYPEKPFLAKEIINLSEFYDLSYSGTDEEETTSFNINNELI